MPFVKMESRHISIGLGFFEAERMAVRRPLSERSACSSLCVSALRKPRFENVDSGGSNKFNRWCEADRDSIGDKTGISEKLRICKISHQVSKVSLTISTNIYLCRFYTKPSPKSCQPLLRSIKGKNPKAPGPLRD